MLQQRRAAVLVAAVAAVCLLVGTVRALDPQLDKFKDVPEDVVTTVPLVDTSYYTDPSQIKINVNCEPQKGELALVFEPDEASPGTLLFKPYAGAQGQDFFTFTVEGPLKPGLTPEKVGRIPLNLKFFHSDCFQEHRAGSGREVSVDPFPRGMP